jgi:hypothetical protein
MGPSNRQGGFDTIAHAPSSHYCIIAPDVPGGGSISRPVQYSLVEWKNCRESIRRSNVDGAAYVVVGSIRGDPTTISKIASNNS